MARLLLSFSRLAAQYRLQYLTVLRLTWLGDLALMQELLPTIFMETLQHPTLVMVPLF
jgi:hypothetical protein